MGLHHRASTSGRRRGQRFDAEANVVTESLIFLGELDPDAMGDALEDATHYEPTPLGEFETFLKAIPEPLERFTLYDVGAGMGRVVLLATRFPFKQIVGVEVSPALCEVARDNVVRWRRKFEDIACKDVRIKCADAAAAPFPAGPLAVYLFNPFGERTLARFAQRLKTHAADAYVLYHTPVHRHVFDEDPAFETAGETKAGLIYRKR